MLSAIGFSSIILALILALFQAAFNIFKLSSNKKNIEGKLIEFNNVIVVAVFAFCLSALLALIYAYVISDYSISNVYLNSHHLKPLIYKISGAWGNHEGSILLLSLILSAYNLAFMNLSKISYPEKAIIITCQSLILSGFLAFTAFTSNPFLTIFPVPKAGLGLNPLLQDIGLAMHPPMLYTGYIGFSLIFSFAIAALLKSRLDKYSIKMIKPWLMLCWSFLTVGIGLGSWWAYRELGWGGYWFWDPVENVSLMPWLCATALFHSLIITEKTGNFKVWSCFLAILSFILCLMGIFLVRSGILTSVHSFANDPARGIFVICFLLLVGGSAFIIFAFKAYKLGDKGKNFALFSKSALILINSFLLCLALFIIVLGTLYPLLLQVFTENSITIGAVYYQQLFAPLTALTLLLMIFIPFLKLESFAGFNSKIVKKLLLSAILSILITCYISASDNFEYNFTSLLVLFGALTVLFSSLLYLFNLKQKYKLNKLTTYAMLLGHLGFALVIIGICTVSLLKQEKETAVKIGDNIDFIGYKINLNKVENVIGKNYIARKGVFIIKSGKDIFELSPETRYYPVADKNTNEAAIKHSLANDFYIVLGNKDEEERFAVRIYYKPLISLIWIGCLLISAGGFLSVINNNIGLLKIIRTNIKK